MSAQHTSAERSSAMTRQLGWLIGVGGFLFCLWFPDLGLTWSQRAVAGTTVLTATFWMTLALPIGASSLLPAVLFPMLSVLPASEVSKPYMHNLVMLFVGAFIVALGLERWGVHRRMALGIVSICGTRPSRLVLGFMVAAAFLSLWINNTATTLMMLPIGLAVIASLQPHQSDSPGADPKSNNAFACCLLLGIAYSSSVGGMGTPVGTAPNQEFLGQLQMRFPNGPQLSFGDWFIAWLPLVITFVISAWFLLTRVLFRLPKDGGGEAAAEVVRAERRALGPMGRGERRMLGVFIATAVLWITRADLNLGLFEIQGWNRLFYGEAAQDPAWYAAHKNDLSDTTVALFMAVLCFAIPVNWKKAEFLMDWQTAKGLPWDILLLLGAGICLAAGFKTSGLDQVVGELLAPLVSGRSTWVLVGATVLFVTFLTELTSNTATTAVLLPILASTAVESGVHPLLLMAPATIAASCAFMLPSATPPNAVVFTSRLIPIPTMARAGLVLNLWMAALVVICFQVWVRRIWQIGVELPTWAQGTP